MFRYFNYIFPTSKPIPLSDLEMEVYAPAKRHTHTIVFLHGRDDTAAEFASSLFESQASDGKYLQETFPSVKWIFPQAPLILSERFGLEFSQWFDMWSTEHPHDGEDGQDPTMSIDAVHKILTQEERIIGAGNIVLAGISQGCAVAIHALLKQPFKLGGFVGIAGWLPKPSTVANVRKRFPCALDTPLLLQHNLDDAVLVVSYGEELRDRLGEIGMKIEWRTYEKGGHWINEGVLEDEAANQEQDAVEGIGERFGQSQQAAPRALVRPDYQFTGHGTATGSTSTSDLPTGVDHIVDFLDRIIGTSKGSRRVWESRYEGDSAVPATSNGDGKAVRFE